ncbi:phospholipase D-like domain-containing protein [Bacillus safensis]|uniref:phospholipase D-like domain-containing protein n=1 Tax=Bacillus safensis TaxID=561879 RepID=UPI0022812602|nr:phospholipase D-like domain-containing protein [Bacillus safensis]MCY7737666.1 phospholipase D-like domain-containing protein [Bacillus safensis]
MDKIIITEIVRFVHQCLQEGNHEFFHQWMKELSSLDMKESPRMPQSRGNFPFSFEHGVYEIIRAASTNQMSTEQLIDNFQVAYEMAQYTLDTQPLITPVWTGPVHQSQLIPTQTLPAVKELIDTANQEVFIVGYSFSFSYDELKQLLKSLEDAAQRKCRITLIVNNEERNFQALKSNWNEDSFHLLNIYSWLENNSTGYSSLHSKLIITDQKKMLLTSANFSYHGFVKNIETGVIIEQHEVVKTFWQQFRSLLENNQIKKIF